MNIQLDIADFHCSKSHIPVENIVMATFHINIELLRYTVVIRAHSNIELCTHISGFGYQESKREVVMSTYI